MSKLPTKNFDMKHWFKITAFTIATLAVILVSGYFIKNASSKGLSSTLGTAEMSQAELKTFQKVTGVVDIQQWVTDRGVRVYYVESPNLPMVDIEMTFDAGSARDEAKPGLASLTNTLLFEGTKDINADQVAETLESLGIQLYGQSYRDMAMIHLRSLTDAELLSPAISLVSKLLSEPTFDEIGFSREREKSLQVLQYEAQSPKKVAEKSFFATVYANQPYASWPTGTEQSLKAMTTQDLKAFHQKYYNAKNVVVSIVGAVNQKEAHALVEKLTSALPMGERAPALAEVTVLKKRVVKKQAFPSNQTHIMIGAPSITRADPDYYPLTVGNHILGGNGTVTRLFAAIRHDRGLAYDVRSYFVPMRSKGPYILGSQTKKESSAEVLGLLDATLKKFIAEGPTDEELNKAKQNLLGGYPLRFDSNQAIVSNLSSLGFYDLPLDYFDRSKEAISKVTLAEIKDAYSRRVHPEEMTVILVGEA